MLGLLLGNSVGGEIPHLGVAVLYVLLHAEERSLGLVLAVVHVLELLQVGLDILVGVLASVSWAFFTLFSSALELNLGLVAVTNVSLLFLDELLGEVKKSLEVIARVCNGAGGEAWKGQMVPNIRVDDSPSHLTILIIHSKYTSSSSSGLVSSNLRYVSRLKGNSARNEPENL